MLSWPMNMENQPLHLVWYLASYGIWYLYGNISYDTSYE